MWALSAQILKDADSKLPSQDPLQVLTQLANWSYGGLHGAFQFGLPKLLRGGSGNQNGQILTVIVPVSAGERVEILEFSIPEEVKNLC